VRSIPTKDLVALSDELRGSGLELPDDLRRDCNRYIAGKWLFEFFRSGGSTHGSPDAVQKLAPGVADTCRNASLVSATIVIIPEPRFPRLNADASPALVRADGTYQLVHGGDFVASRPAVSNYNTRKVRVQLSHWSQLLALPLTARMAADSAIRSTTASP
jgi:hypothetical protein